MVTNKDYQQVIEDKIKEAKNRAAPKRDWAKFNIAFLDSSINYRMELSEQAVFVKIILMSVKYGPVPGLISDNDCRAMPRWRPKNGKAKPSPSRPCQLMILPIIRPSLTPYSERA